jgi:SanA protein
VPLQWRLAKASDLYKKGLVKRILVSGDNSRRNYNEPMAMKQWLVDNGVPAGDIACDFAGRRTLDSCARAVELWGVRDNAILVSQAYHLPRALYLAESWGMDAVAVPADSGTFRSNLVRESLARVKAWLDMNILGTEPAFWGTKEHWPGDKRDNALS